MEFTGSIQFADESSWLTLTTESDDEVTIKVTVTYSGEGTEDVEFTVTPYNGVARLPIGEILRAIISGYHYGITCTVTATQGSATCSQTGSRVFPCGKFTLANANAAIFSDKPKMAKAFDSAPDRICVFCEYGASITAYARLIRKDGTESTYFCIDSTSSTRGFYNIDVSCDRIKALAASNALSTDFVAYKVWMAGTLGTSDTYTFEVGPSRLPRKTYKFLGRRGTYEYIHATGKFSRSIESETQVFVTSGIEQELENDYSMTFEQNSGHIDSIGMGGYWLEFLASKERYVIEKDGSERQIIVNEHKTTLADRSVSSLTFKWHYANPNNTVIDNVDIALTGLVISGDSTVYNDNNTAQFSVAYTPSNTTQRGILWSVVSGSDYASIDDRGKLTVKEGANGSTVKIRATSKDNSSVYAEKSVTVTYKIASVSVTGVSLSKSVLSLAVGESETLVATVVPERASDRSVTWASSNKNIATVNQSGTVTAVAAGSAVIGVRTNDGGFSATCSLTVAAVVNEYTLTVNCTTSGATVKVLEYVAGQSSIADAVTYTEPMTFRENTTVKVWAHKDGMIDSGMQTIVMDSNKTATVACKTIPGWNLESEMSAEAAGLSIPYEVSDPDSVGWRLESDADWITVDSDVAIDVNTNSSSGSRTGHVSLICDAVETNHVVATCTVTQAAGASSELTPSIKFESDSVSAKATYTEYSMLFLAQNLTDLTAAVTGTLVDATARVNTTSRIIKVSFAANTTTEERVGTVTVTGTRTDGKGTYSKSFTITQAAAAEEKYLRVSPTTLNVPADKTQFSNTDGTLTIEANQSWTAEVTSGDDWLDIDAVDGTGDGTNGIILLESNTGSERTGTILFTGADGTEVTVAVTQAAIESAVEAEFTVMREAVSGLEWGLVTEDMATETAALADFVGWYKSGIAGTANGVTVTKLTFNVTTAGAVTVEFCSDAESKYDYLVAAAMDESTELTKVNADTLAEVTTKGNQGIVNKITKTYDLTAGTHTLQILYLKDASRNEGTDSGYYRVLSESEGDDTVLPSGYEAVEYIASKGASGSLSGDLPYIDTGIIDRSDRTYHVEFTVYPTSESGVSRTTYPFIMGSTSQRATGTTVKQVFTGNFPGDDLTYGTTGMTGEQSGAWGGNRSGGNSIVLFGVLPLGARHTLEWNYDQALVLVDGSDTSGKIVNSRSADTVETSYSCYLFAVNMAGSPVDGDGNDQRRGWLKLHRLWIKDSAGTLLCDLYPCKNADDTYGLYDTVRNTFLTSANDKTFTGPDEE